MGNKKTIPGSQLLITAILCLALSSVKSEAKNYYFDSLSKATGNVGSIDNSWMHLDSVNNHTFKPGDTIFIKRGRTINGYLSPKGSGNNSAHGQIVLTAYGSGALPVIDAYGCGTKPLSPYPQLSGWAKWRPAIFLYNQHYWTIENLEVKNDIDHNLISSPIDTSFKPYLVTNTNSTYRANLLSQSAQRYGILVQFGGDDTMLADGTIVAGIKIHKNIVTHIYGSYCHDPAKINNFTAYYNCDGIGVHAGCTPNNNFNELDNILIDSNQVYDVVGEGISVGAGTEFPGTGKWNPLGKNVVIRGNYVKRTASNAISIGGTDNVLIEFNVVDSAEQLGYGLGTGGHGDGDRTQITFDGDAFQLGCNRNGIIRYNVVSHTKVWHCDGMAFDADYCESGSPVFEYNYTHDNDGQCFSEGRITKRDIVNDAGRVSWKDYACTGTVFRYNISQNDHRWNGTDQGVISLNRGSAHVYNNIFYANDSLTISMSSCNSDASDKNQPDSLVNNIFFAPKCVAWLNKDYDVYTHNCYAGGLPFGVLPNDPAAVKADPQFVAAAGSGGKGISSLGGYKLKLSSPCICKGLNMSVGGMKDFWGNLVVQGCANIGVNEGKGK